MTATAFCFQSKLAALMTSDGATLDELVPVLIDRPVPPAHRPWLGRVIRAARTLRYG